jgi:hypothetical protein
LCHGSDDEVRPHFADKVPYCPYCPFSTISLVNLQLHKLDHPEARNSRATSPSTIYSISTIIDSGGVRVPTVIDSESAAVPHHGPGARLCARFRVGGHEDNDCCCENAIKSGGISRNWRG